MQIALDRVEHEKIIIMEDDEYYAPNYIEEMTRRLELFELVGIGRSKYYHLPTFQHYSHKNMGHASLAQTAFRRSFLPEVKQQLAGDFFFDIRIWRLVNGFKADHLEIPQHIPERISDDKRGFVFQDLESLYVGMKGMPGRGGIGSGHIPKVDSGYNPNSWYINDVDKSVLRKWIIKEEDFQTYAAFPNADAAPKLPIARVVPIVRQRPVQISQRHTLTRNSAFRTGR